MRADLKSGAWVELRGADQLVAGDKLALHQSTVLPVNGAELDELAEGRGRMSFSLGTVDEQLYNVLARLIQAWSYPYVLPRDDITQDDNGKRTYDESLKRLPLDDWNELEEITAPHMDKLRASPKGKRTTSTRSASSSAARGRSSQTV